MQHLLDEGTIIHWYSHIFASHRVPVSNLFTNIVSRNKTILANHTHISRVGRALGNDLLNAAVSVDYDRCH